MDVLRLTTTDYTLTISTASIDYAWERFASRVGNKAQSYCDYRSTREGTLALYQPDGKKPLLPLEDGKEEREWKEHHPVMFETCEYQFAVEFKHIHTAERMQPRVRHQLKSIGEAFKFYKNGDNSGILVGTIDFLNSPGKFSFDFDFNAEDGTLQKESVEMYVASPKLGNVQKITSAVFYAAILA